MTQRTIKWNYPFIAGTDDSAVDIHIAKALKAMSAFYDELTYEGYMDGHHFCITKVINDITGEPLTERDLWEAYYFGDNQEDCISIKL